MTFAQEAQWVATQPWSYSLTEQILLRHPEAAGAIWSSNRPWTVQDLSLVVERVDSLGLDDVGPWIEGLRRGSLPGGSDEGKFPVRNGFSLRAVGDLRKDRTAFDPAFLAPRVDEDGTVPAYVMVEHELGTRFREWLEFGWRLSADANAARDPARFRGDSAPGDGEFRASVLEAYATAHRGLFRLTAGRQTIRLGPGRASSVFLSDSAPAMDQVRLELGGDRIKFTGLIARLSGDLQNRSLSADGATIPGSTPPEESLRRVDRLLYLHRVDWRVVPRLQVAISETALATGVDRGLEFRYANLLAPFFLSQLDEDAAAGVDVNVNVVAEAVVWPVDGLELYAAGFAQELFVDQAKRDSIGNQLAWRLGGKLADPFGQGGITLGAEYTRVDVFTYLHRGLNTNWTTFSAPLGSTLGPDADQAMAWIDWYARPLVRLTGELLLRRAGERDLGTLESVIEAGNPPFPSGTVQRELRAGLDLAAWFPDRGLEGFLGAGFRYVDDVGNVQGVTDKYWEARIGVRYRRVFPLR